MSTGTVVGLAPGQLCRNWKRSGPVGVSNRSGILCRPRARGRRAYHSERQASAYFSHSIARGRSGSSSGLTMFSGGRFPGFELVTIRSYFQVVQEAKKL